MGTLKQICRGLPVWPPRLVLLCGGACPGGEGCGRVLVVVTAPEVHVNTFWFWFWSAENRCFLSRRRGGRAYLQRADTLSWPRIVLLYGGARARTAYDRCRVVVVGGRRADCRGPASCRGLGYGRSRDGLDVAWRFWAARAVGGVASSRDGLDVAWRFWAARAVGCVASACAAPDPRWSSGVR